MGWEGGTLGRAPRDEQLDDEYSVGQRGMEGRQGADEDAGEGGCEWRCGGDDGSAREGIAEWD